MNRCYQKYLVVLDISYRAEYRSKASGREHERKTQIEEEGKRGENTD